MERIPNGRYTKEFREEAVKMATEGGLAEKRCVNRPCYHHRCDYGYGLYSNEGRIMGDCFIDLSRRPISGKQNGTQEIH